ncbi:MAG: DUF1810 domain-containing protein [Rhizomicrobium sp.]
MSDPFRLCRFVEAQGAIWPRVLDELRVGRKQGHWMWFVFPQIAGLGVSAMAERYAIGSLAEADDYRGHPLLGPRLRQATGLVLAIEGCNAHAIFGAPDDLKFCSSMTLFDRVVPQDVFAAALEKYFAGAPDPATLVKLRH